MSDEKTEEPTDKKLEDARKKGQLPQSKDLASAFAFGFAFIALLVTGTNSADHFRNIVHSANKAFLEDEAVTLVQYLYSMVIDGVWIAAPVIIAAIIGSIAGGLAHVGVNISFEPLLPKPEKVDPVQGVKRIFSLRSLFEVFKAVVKAVFLSWIIFESIRAVTPLMMRAMYGSSYDIAHSAWLSLDKLFKTVAVIFVVLGVIDFVVQKLLFKKDQKMTKDEVKREYKQMEGDPQIKGERKAIAQEIAFSDPAPATAQANALVVNPTHFAVALYYDEEQGGLPVVTAKGADEQALYMRKIAGESGVPIVGNPVLARALFKQPIDSAVPEQLLESVAIVLRWAQQLKDERDT